MSWSISSARTHFLHDNRPEFLLADTAWAAFTSVSEESFARLLRKRRAQGFNAIQFNVLPQWDRSVLERDTLKPFEPDGAGGMDYARPNQTYFERAVHFARMAQAHGLTPWLTLLWCNYVPDTWAQKMLRNPVMPLPAVAPYCRFVAETFASCSPLYSVSGDTDFPEASTPYYLTALETLKQSAPEALATLHIGGMRSDLPEVYVDSPALDFYSYQSGHLVDKQYEASSLAAAFRDKRVKRPVVNAEPCYEAHGSAQGRFDASDVRHALWLSLLGGASAGIGYGAHGVWGFHEQGAHFPAIGFSGIPLDHHQALNLPGAWDYSFARFLSEHFELLELDMLDTRRALSSRTDRARAASTPDRSRIVIYVPEPEVVTVNLDLREYDMRGFMLDTRSPFVPELQVEASKATLHVTEQTGHVLLVAVRRELG